ncbi:MAG: hypothetical protein ABDH37_03615 [Candidatus Hydrothermales bacterium]
MNRIIESGKKVYLPKSILKLPVFNRKAFVYEVNFLGNLRVYRIKVKGGKKEKVYIKNKLSPKDSAFLIHLALRLNVPGKEISFEEFYRNFASPFGDRYFSNNDFFNKGRL